MTAAGLLLVAAPAIAALPADRPGDGGAPALERCGPTPAPGSRCADARQALGGLGQGARLEGTLVSEVAVVAGRIHVTLSGEDGRLAEVEIARPDPSDPDPPARTPTLSLYLRSDVPGEFTPAWQLTALRSLAARLERSPAPAPPWLLPLRGGKDRTRP